MTLCTNRLLYIQEQFHNELSQLFSEVTALNTVIPEEQMITIRENNGIIDDFGEDFPSKFDPNQFDPNTQIGLIPSNTQFRLPNSSTSPDLIGFDEDYVPEYLSNFKMPSNMQKTRSLGNIRIDPDSSPKENHSFDSGETGSIDQQKYKFSYSPNQIYYLKEDYSSTHGNLQRGDRVALQDVHKHGWLSVTSLDYDGMDQIVLPEGLLSEVKVEPRFSEPKIPEHRSFESRIERMERDSIPELKPPKSQNSIQKRNLSSAEAQNLPDSPNVEKSLSLPKNPSPNLNRNSKKYPSKTPNQKINQNPVKIESKTNTNLNTK